MKLFYKIGKFNFTKFLCTLSHFVRQEYTTTFEHDARLYTCTRAHVSTSHTNARSHV